MCEANLAKKGSNLLELKLSHALPLRHDMIRIHVICQE